MATDSNALEMAKEMYMRHHSLDEICINTGMKMSTLKNYTRDWSKERDAASFEILKALDGSKQKLLHSICNNGLKALDQLMKKIVSGEVELGAKGLTQISNLIKIMHGITQIEAGMPTNIIAEIKPEKPNDPFAEEQSSEDNKESDKNLIN